MFLVEIYNDNIRTGDPDFRLSSEFQSFEHLWEEGLIDISGIDYALDTPHGGMIKSNFGIMSFLPTIVPNDYIGVDIWYSNSDEANKILLFDGIAYVNSRSRTATAYDLFADVPNTIIPDGGLDLTSTTVYDIFADFFTTPWTLVTINYTTANTDVDIASYGAGQLYMDFLSELCQTYKKYFILDTPNNIVYLRDFDGIPTHPEEVDGFSYLPSRYNNKIPPSKVSVGDGKDYSGYPFGGDLNLKSFNPLLTLNDTLASNILDVYISKPLEVTYFMPLEYFVAKGINFFTNFRIAWTDDSVPMPGGLVDYEMDILKISFNVQKNEVILSGNAEIS